MAVKAPNRKVKVLSDTEIGKIFESKLHNAFAPLPSKYPCTWERILDSAAAGNLVRPARADFELNVRSHSKGQPYCFYIECKASVVNHSFTVCFKEALKPTQNAGLTLGARAGSTGLVLFYSESRGEVEIWQHEKIAEAYLTPRAKIYNPFMTISLSNLESLALKMVTDPAFFIP
jgi:hypothetical protein